jgi:stage II sporulation protein AA (anti-sigma F factor antagonist)
MKLLSCCHGELFALKKEIIPTCRIKYLQWGVMNMDIKTKRLGRTLLLELHGELDLSTAPVLKDVVEREMARRRTTENFIFGMKNVSFIDSSGVGVILGCYKRAAQLGGELALSEVAPQVLRILDISGVLRLMRVFDSDTDAVRTIGGDRDK